MADQYQYPPELWDAAKRVAAEYTMHKDAGKHDAYGKWIAVALADGSSDHTLYDSKRDAIRHQHHNEDYYAYVQIGPWSMSTGDAATYLATTRRMYDAGLRLADRDHAGGGRDMIPRLTRDDQYAQLRAMFRGDRPPTNIIIPGLGRYA